MLQPHQIAVDETRINVLTAGQGRPLVLIHAYPLSSQLFREVITPLAEHGHVIACDNRGFGASSVTPTRVPMEQYARDIERVLAQLEVSESAIVLGVSMGGYIAMRFADLFPERTAGLLLCHTRAEADSPEAAAKRELLAQKIESEGAAVVQNVPLKLLGASTQKERPELIETLRSWILATDPNGIAAALRGMAERPDSTRLIHSAPFPIGFIAGDEDTFTPVDEMTALAESTGRALQTIARAGHLSPIEQPAAFCEAVGQFVRSVDSTA